MCNVSRKKTSRLCVKESFIERERERERESLKERAQQRPDRVFVKEGEG